MSEKSSRRDFVKTAAAGIVGFGLGAGVGYGASRIAAPPPELTPTGTETLGPGKTPKGVPKEPIKLGIVSWFTGPSTMVGEACLGGAQFAADVVNQAGGILGRKIEVLKRDAGTPDVTVDAVRRFVLEDRVDLMAGDIGGSNANAITTHVEQLKTPFFLQCSTTVKMVEELDPNPSYLFRSGEQNLAEPNVAAQLISREFPNAKRIAGINPDYVYGHEAMTYSMKALNKLTPQMESVIETWPPQFATDFSSHITAVLDAKPDIVITACWGGDFVTLAKQGSAYGLFEKTKVVSILGSMALNSLTKDLVPEGIWMLQRDYYFMEPPHNLYPLNKWFVEEYRKRTNKYPEFDVMQIFSAIFAYKQAIERVYNATGSYPENEEICRAIQNSSVISPVGHRTITGDGQFLNALPYGRTMHHPDYAIAILDPETVGFVQPEHVYNPKSLPPVLQYPLGTGMKYSDWIESW